MAACGAAATKAPPPPSVGSTPFQPPQQLTVPPPTPGPAGHPTVDSWAETPTKEGTTAMKMRTRSTQSGPRAAASLGMVTAAAIAITATAAAAAPTATPVLNPPPPAFEACSTTGAGTVCQGTRTLVEDPVDTGLVCGTGSTAFDIWDQGTALQRVTRRYDVNGNLTERVSHEQWSNSYWSNPANGRTVPYTQNNIFTDRLAIPGDFTSSVQTQTGESIYRAGSGTGAPVLFGNGRQVYNWDGSDLISASGRNSFVAAFFYGDTHAFDQVCHALS
jgi:hypothetical protein